MEVLQIEKNFIEKLKKSTFEIFIYVTAVFQYISTFDSTVFKTVSRVGDQLREIIYFKMNEIDLTKSRTFGDVIPKLKSNSQLINLSYEILHESDVEHVINRINFDIFGSSLVQIPDPNNTYLIFIACHLDHTIQNNIDYS